MNTVLFVNATIVFSENLFQVILPLTPFGLLLVYPITLSMASWILGYGFMITCYIMPIIMASA